MNDSSFEQMQAGETWEVQVPQELLPTLTYKVKVVEKGMIAVSPDPQVTRINGAKVELLAINGIPVDTTGEDSIIILSRQTLESATKVA